MMLGTFVFGIIVFLVVVAIAMYNDLVQLRQRVKNAWSQVDIQLKRRYDLIPNLVNVVKGYAEHETKTFENVTKARNAAMNADNIKDKIDAENALAGTLKSLFAVVEAYPQLQANTNFLNLQMELSETEEKIAFSRQFYNDTVQKFNTKIEMFPNSLIARNAGFVQEEYYSLDDEQEARQNVNVQF